MVDDAPPRPSAPRSVLPGVWVLIVLALVAALHFRERPEPDRTAIRAREQAALQQLVTIQRAQTRYFSRFVRFATKLEELGPTGANLVPADLAKGVKTGYQFTLTGGPASYTINANPVNFGTTGRRTFFSDQSKVVRENWGSEPATPNSPEIK